jgi:hypothetical protein
MIVTLTNNFHNTEVRVRIPDSVVDGPDDQERAWAWLQAGNLPERFGGDSRRRVCRRVEQALCGCDCECGVVRPL